MINSIVLAAGMLAANPSAGAEALRAEIDAIFEDFTAAGAPGCAVGVIHRGEWLHQAGYGLADLEHPTPINADSVFRIASVSKQVTAAAIALLDERGELDIDADVHEYLPELTDYGTTVTIRQMVHHISGMGDYYGFEVREGRDFRFGNEDFWTIQEFYDEVAQKELAGEPGQEFAYSNLAYFLLSQVVEKVSGQSLNAFATENFFEPLGMNDTFFNENVNQIVPNRASGYGAFPDDGGYENYDTNLSWVGDGGLYTTLNDFYLWDQAFHNATGPITPSFRDRLQTPHPLTAEQMADSSNTMFQGGYAYGMFVGEREGEAVLSHTGAWVGYRAAYARLPEHDASTILFCNRTDGMSGRRASRLLDAVIGYVAPSDEEG
jgi:CubicO group peptidase (beta-lactamase class C family)